LVLVNFGTGKCPLCGDYGKKLEKKAFQCRKCRIRFDHYWILSTKELREASKYWN
jgi:tRNA(Ile2) C34 agmatinyltransferase TiaS